MPAWSLKRHNKPGRHRRPGYSSIDNAALSDPSTALWITEGQKKADALTTMAALISTVYWLGHADRRQRSDQDQR
jgi:hypothetical protein